MYSTDLSPLSAAAIRDDRRAQKGPAARVGRASPPRGFKLLRGNVWDVQFGGTVPPRGRTTVAQRLGLNYEQRVHDVLSAIYTTDYRCNASILFRDATGPRRAIPDGLLALGSTLVIVECKLTHCERAWWQLQRLYLPLLSRLVVPGTTIRCVEICRSYDPSVAFPEPHEIVTSLHRIPRTGVGVLQWKF